jgi:hypothetical protein
MGTTSVFLKRIDEVYRIPDFFHPPINWQVRNFCDDKTANALNRRVATVIPYEGDSVVYQLVTACERNWRHLPTR